eukprot:m.134389 g.134389  ORF g.134389 m.134389 type:complete len:51 (-) comp29737_c0_seq2:372-524(-)
MADTHRLLGNDDDDDRLMKKAVAVQMAVVVLSLTHGCKCAHETVRDSSPD